MKTAHKGLAIPGADWDLAVKASRRLGRRVQGAAKEKGEFLGAVAAMEGDIVEKP
jgi:hypothetical protein